LSDVFLAGQTLPAGQLNGFVQSGTATVSLVSAITGNAEVTFPVPFIGTPQVTATVVFGTFAGSAAVWGMRGGNLTSTGCTLRIYRVDSTTNITADIDVHWIAHGTPDI
jgi:hypothetical protein